MLHVQPSWDWGVHEILGNIVSFKFSDNSVVMIMILMSVMCARSLLRQLNAKPDDLTFRTLFYDSLFGQESQVFKSPFPILIVISLPISLWYLVTMIFYTSITTGRINYIDSFTLYKSIQQC